MAYSSTRFGLSHWMDESSAKAIHLLWPVPLTIFGVTLNISQPVGESNKSL